MSTVTDARVIVAERLADAGLLSDRLIPVQNGGKASLVRHNDRRNRKSSVDAISGNYGVYAGANPDGDRWLIDVDIDDYDAADSAALEAVQSLPDTLTVASPHTDGESGGHRYYYIDAKDVPGSIEAVAGAKNPSLSWGEIRVQNQYVVGPGSRLDGCDKAWCDECEKPDGGRYELATDAPIAELSLSDLFDVIRADESAESAAQAGASVDTSKDTPTDHNDDTHARAVAEHYDNIQQYLMFGSDDRSESDFHICCRMIEHGVDEREAYTLLADNSNSKVDAPDASGDYWTRTWQKAERQVGADANTESLPTQTDGGAAASSSSQTPTEPERSDSAIVSKFTTACERYQINPNAVGTQAVDGEKLDQSVESIVSNLPVHDAVFAFKRNADSLDGTEKQAVIGYVILLDLQEHGEFFETTTGPLYYFFEPEREVYRVDDAGRRVLTEAFQGLVWERYNLFAGRFSRDLGKDIKSQARRNAPERAVYRFAHYDPECDTLYVNDHGDGYYAVTPNAIEWRANGTDVFFLSTDRAEGFEYIKPENRSELPDELPGERPMWLGNGDAIMRLFGNRVNYDESAALGPTEQRKQLYLHLHTLPFVDALRARPIMAWIGEKGSGKTVLQRSIGKFIYGPEFRESVMPDAKDDFLAKVTNQALAFLDNYDDGVEWANDILAAVATGAGIDKREYFTTNTLYQEVPRCWLSLTSRDPPCRRDDVADRTLVFRVERVEEGFVGEADYYRQVECRRDLLWSVYLDNLQSIVRTYTATDTATMSSDHRMADWAIFARIVADALDVDDVAELLETMETERATFALENENWAKVLGEWIAEHPDTAAEWHSAGTIGNSLESHAEKNDMPISVTSASGIGSKLTQYRSELGDLYGLQIDNGGRSNKYRFETDDGHDPSGLGAF